MAFDQTKRVYPRLPAGTHPDVIQAFNDLHDNVYELRGQIQTMKAEKPAVATASRKAFNDNIGGIKVKSPTDPSTLKNGYTIRYNSKTGQFEFGV